MQSIDYTLNIWMNTGNPNSQIDGILFDFESALCIFLQILEWEMQDANLSGSGLESETVIKVKTFQKFKHKHKYKYKTFKEDKCGWWGSKTLWLKGMKLALKRPNI